MADNFPQSATIEIPTVSEVPAHIAVIMDGNGRWANARKLPRVVGHERGVAALRTVVEACMRQGVRYLTVFAFSSENWRRPEDEVSFLMKLFLKALQKEVRELKANGVRLRVIGDRAAFNETLRQAISSAEAATEENDRFNLTVAANYGGRWDILQATRKMLDRNPALVQPGAVIGEELLSPHLSMAFAPEPDLFIRTGGEERISNFLIWQLAYTEFYFTQSFWPDFGEPELTMAIESYRRRERRFGRTSAQLAQCSAPVS
jgi:undecaprenyl diphosphate synthase